MIITEGFLREHLPVPTYGAVIRVAQTGRFTPSARDYITTWKLNIFAEDIGEQLYVNGRCVEDLQPVESAVSSTEETNTATTMPELGEPISQLPPDQLETVSGSLYTRLDEDRWVPKTHPHIVMRGHVESVYATLAMAQAVSFNEQSALCVPLEECLTFLTELHTALRTLPNEFPQYLLQGKNPRELQPEMLSGDALLRGAIPPHNAASMTVHWINIARTQLRALEITALETFGQSSPEGLALLQICNDMANGLYVMQHLDFPPLENPHDC